MTVAYEYRPGVLYLNVTNRCSNDCTFCVRRGPGFSLAGHDMRLHREPTAEEVHAAVARAEQDRGAPFDEVVFCGFGEPTYRLGLIAEVGSVLRRRDVSVRLNTNGQAALIGGGEPWDALAEAVDTVSVSLNAPDAEAYRILCRPAFGAEAFPAVLEFVRQAQRHVSAVQVTVVGWALRAEQLRRCRLLASDLGVPLRIR